jgi:uncharacterized protein (UPF0332 family)
LNKADKLVLINYRMERAKESLKAAELMLENGLLIPAMNRIYYSMFYAVQALLILDEKAFGKHGQVKGYFNKEYIKDGLFPKEFGKLYNTVFEYRQKFDYVDLSMPEEELIADYIHKAENFVNHISSFLDKNLSDLQ